MQSNIPQFDFRRQIFMGWGAILFLVGFFFLWSVLAPLSSGAVVGGRIVVDTNRKQIQNFDGGIVQEILVKDGDQVSTGDLLAVLRSDELINEISRLSSEQLALLAQKARLEAELLGQDEINFPVIFETSDQHARKQHLVDKQVALFEARKANKAIELEIYEGQISQFHEQTAGYRQQISAYRLGLELLQSEVTDLETLLAKGLTQRSRILDLKRREATVLSQLAERESWIAETELQISEKRLQILQLKRSFNETISNDLATLEAKLFDVADRLQSLKNKLDRSRITSPSEGIVLGSQLHTIGGVVSPSETLMEIVPQQERLIIAAEASPLDIDIIQIGDLARVRITALSVKLTPLLSGRVINLAPDSSYSKSGELIYALQVEIPPEEFSKLDGVEVLPGMPVEVLIDRGEQTLLTYLLRPLSSVLFRSMKES